MKFQLINKTSFFAATLCLFIGGIFTSCNKEKKTETKASPEEWISLFNGKDLSGWTPKFAGYPAGENFNNTFRVSNGLLQANYSQYDSFKNEFGHLFYKDEFSYYRLRTKYRMVGEQTKGAGEWAYANNGLMLHCQSVETMTQNQGFPLSIEFQLLGGNGSDERNTGNLCTPGCHVTLNNKLEKQHCINSNSKTYHGEQWVNAEAIVLGDSIIHHVIEGDTVMTYFNPVIGGALGGLDTLQFPEGKPMTKGYISIQAESHQTEFEFMELLDLCGCMDKKAKNYKDYYIKSAPETCIYE